MRLRSLSLIAILLASTCVMLISSPALATENNAPILQELVWKNLWKSDPVFLSKVLNSKPGKPFSTEEFAEDLIRLKSWELYRYVRGVTFPSATGVTAMIDLGERWTITPVLRPRSGGGVYSLKLGGRDTNFLGRFYEIGAYGGGRYSSDILTPLAGGWLLFPYLAGSDWDLQIWGDWDFFEDPVYSHSDKPDLIINRRTIQIYPALGYRFADDFKLSLWTRYRDRQEEPREDFEYTPQNDFFITSRSRQFAIGPELVLGAPEYSEPLYEGQDLRLMMLMELSDAYAPALYLSGEGRSFTVLGSWLNIAARVRTEWTNSHEWSQLRTLGGLTNLRGFPDRYFHAKGYVVASTELRATAFNTKWLSLQMKVFADVALMIDRYEGQRLHPLDAAYSAGVGAFVWVPFMHKMRLRIDVARPLNRSMVNGIPDISSGIVQFF